VLSANMAQQWLLTACPVPALLLVVLGSALLCSMLTLSTHCAAPPFRSLPLCRRQRRGAAGTAGAGSTAGQQGSAPTRRC